MKSKEDKLDIGKLETNPVDLSKLSDAVKNDLIKKTEYDELAKKVSDINSTDTSDLVKKLTISQKLTKLKRRLVMMIMINVLLLIIVYTFVARLKQANLAIYKKDRF